MDTIAPVIGIGLAAAGAIGAVWFAVRAIRWAKKGTNGAKALASAVFLFPDQPPPQEQIEQQIRLKRDSEAAGREE